MPGDLDRRSRSRDGSCNGPGDRAAAGSGLTSAGRRRVRAHTPEDLLGHYQHVNTGYPIDSGDSTRVSIGFFHHLTTYLSVLSGGDTPVDPDCHPLG